MQLDAAFAPYRLTPGATPEEAARVATELEAEPLVAAPAVPLPVGILNRALADLPAGRAPSVEEACHAADGSPSGLSGPPRACLSSARHRERVAQAAREALAAGFGGIYLDRPDAPLALGLLGAGFCHDCLRAFDRLLAREYGEQFHPVDYLLLAREALTTSSGAVAFDALPFGREFWRFRTEALDEALRCYVRGARDAGRGLERPFQVVAQFEALGPAQFRAARHLDAALFPGPEIPGTGIGHFRLVRAVLGRRPVAVAAPQIANPASPGAAASLARLAAVAATCGVEISGLEPSGPAGVQVGKVRRLARQLAQQAGRPPSLAQPVAEACLLYSAESDLWTSGRHRLSVVRAGEALAALHLQSPVVTRVHDAPSPAALVLADAVALSPAEAKEVRRRLEGGTAVLCFGEPAQVDEGGRPAGPFLPGGKAGGVKVGSGTLAELPALFPAEGSPSAPDPATLEKALTALLGRGRRAAGVSGRAPLLVVLHKTGDALDVHLVSLGPDRAQGVTLFLSSDIAGGVRRGRFISADGNDVRIPLNPSGYSLSTVLPSFAGYAVLSLAT
ncbi:MAG TPA: hypothetical protein VFG59_15030 [Anaeromyxobacter sp.]|nr:hypothetical protein [Anaeromyxobacter sp.]